MRPEESQSQLWEAGSILKRGGRPEAGWPLGRRAQPQGSGDAILAAPVPWGAGRAPGVRQCHPSGAKGLRRSHSPGGKASCFWSFCPKVDGTARVLPSPAGTRESRAGATPQGGGPRAAEVNRGYPRGVTGRREAGEEGWLRASRAAGTVGLPVYSAAPRSLGPPRLRLCRLLPETPGRTFPSSRRLLSSEEPSAGGAGGGAAAERTASCLKSF